MTPIKKHILFLVPDGVGIKNYLCSDIIKYLKSECDISIWSTLPIDAFNDVKRLHQINFNYKQIVLNPEGILTRLYREASTHARLLRNCKLKDNPTILTNWRPNNYSLKVKLLYLAAAALGKYLSKNYKRILRFEEKSTSKISKKIVDKYSDDLKILNLKSIFITHQRVPGIMPICKAAKQLNITTVTAIFSWDNLPKARLAVSTDLYLVWSQWMKDEMKDYYPEIHEKNVKLVGTPQFEFYLDENKVISRQRFGEKHGLDLDKKWICFSGDDITTSPYDHLFLRDLAVSLNDQKDDLQIIFRRCPVDLSQRYDEVLNEYNNLIVSIDPIWNIESQTGWVGFFPKYEDILMQVNLSYHCDMVINFGSTMAFDFAINNKPCLYLNYNPSKDIRWNTNTIYNFQHFRSMKGLNAVGWINGRDQILKTVLKTLKTPNEIAPDRKKWMETIVLHPLDTNSQNIASAIL
jgi:hypothetical protein